MRTNPVFSLIKLSCGNIALAGLFACLFAWAIEAAIHSYFLREGSLGSHLFSVTSHQVSRWFIDSIIFISLGAYVQWKFDKGIRKQEELKLSCIELDGKVSAQSQILAVEAQGRRKAESALRQEELKFRELFDHINDGILIADTATKKFVEVNRTMCDMLGYAREEVLGLGIRDIHPPQDLPAVFTAFERFVRSNEKVAEDLPVIRKDGTVFYADIGHTAVSLNGRPCAVGVFRDITERKQTGTALNNYRQQLEAMVEDRTRDLEKTVGKLKTEVNERKRAEDTLRRNSAFLRGVFDGIQDGIAVLDTDQNIIMVNRAVERIFRSEGTIGFKTKKCFEVFRQAAERCDNCAAVRAIEEKTTQVETMPYKKDGDGAGRLEISTFPLYDEHGAARGVVLSLRDITEKRMLEERARRNDHLAALGQISAGIAHEINNPNHIIMSGAELLQGIWHDADSVLSEYYALHDDFLLGGVPFSDMQEKVPQIINRILNGSTRINDIVVGMKHCTSSARVAKTEKVNINDVVRVCIEMLSDQIRKRTDNFQSILDDEAPFVSGSRQALEEVITNLVSNALQALTDRTKVVSVATRRERNDNSVILEVRDEGTGMTPEVLRQATNPFFTTKQDSGGMGLGLSISLAIVKNHAGSLDFESKPGRGTVATVRLPASHE